MLPIEINPDSQELKRVFGEFKAYEPRTLRYVGKIINGKPTYIEDVEFPENADIIIIENPKKTAFAPKPDFEEIENRREMVKSLKGCLAGYEMNLDEIREERIAKRGLLE